MDTGTLQVYSWFLGTHKVSVVLGVTGYALVVRTVGPSVGAFVQLLPPRCICETPEIRNFM